MADLAGKIVAGMPLEKPLAQGAISTMYQTQSDGKPAAIKILNERNRYDAALGKTMIEGWEKARTVTNPNLVKILKTGVDAELGAYCVQELLKTKSLRKIINDGMKMNWRDGLEIATQLVTGLKALHDAGQTHGGFWPGNVLLTLDMDVKLTGAGGLSNLPKPLAEILDAPAPAYFAPERIQGALSSPGADLYSAGMCVYYLFAAAEPFPGQDPRMLAQYVIDKKPPALLSFRDDLPAAVTEFIDRLTAKDPTKRYGKADDVLKDLALLKNGKPMNPLQGGVAAQIPLPNTRTPAATIQSNIRTPGPTPLPNTRTPGVNPAGAMQGLRQLEDPARVPTKGPRGSGNRLTSISGHHGTAATNVFGKLQTHVGSTIPGSPKEKEGDEHYRSGNLGAALVAWKEAPDTGQEHSGLKIKIELGEFEFKEIQAEAALGEARLCLDNGDVQNALKHAAEARKSNTDSIRLEAGKLEEKAFLLEKQLLQKKKMTIIIAAAVGVVILIVVVVMMMGGKK